MNIRTSGLIIAALLLTAACGRAPLTRRDYPPRVLDGRLVLRFNNHAEAVNLRGNWSPPLLGKGQRFYRRLNAGAKGGVLFQALEKTLYVLRADIQPADSIAEVRLNGHPLKNISSRIFLPKEWIFQGENILEFSADQRAAFFKLALFPREAGRRTRAPGDLESRDRLFTPGRLRYHILPLPGEYLELTLQSSDHTVVTCAIEITPAGESTSVVSRKFRRDSKVRIPLAAGKPQQVDVLPGIARNRSLRVIRSELVRPQPPAPDELERYRDLARGKNLLVLLLDAARRDHFGCYGYSRPATPYADRESWGAIRFTSARSEASYTLASTGTLLTGLPPDVHGVIAKEFSSLAPDTTTLAELFREKGYFTAAISGNPNFSRTFGYHKGFEAFIQLFDDKPVAMAEEFIPLFSRLLDKRGERPFYFYLHIREPHDPTVMPAPFLGRFQDRFKTKSPELLQVSNWFHDSHVRGGHDMDLLERLYDENLLYGDWALGKVLNTLHERGLTDETLVVILSDHGEAIGEHGLIGHGHVLFREGLGIPLILRLPGLEPREPTHPVVTSDLVVTLAQLFRLPYPYYSLTQGHSLLESRARRTIHRSILTHGFPDYAVIQWPYKLLINLPVTGADSLRLFNLEGDPRETQDLSADLPLTKDSLLHFFRAYLETIPARREHSRQTGLSPAEIESLKSLGYL